MLKQNFEEAKKKLKGMIYEMNYTKEEIEKIVEAEIHEITGRVSINELYEYFYSELIEITAEEHFSSFEIFTGGGVKLGGVLHVMLSAMVNSCMQKELIKELTEKLH